MSATIDVTGFTVQYCTSDCTLSSPAGSVAYMAERKVPTVPQRALARALERHRETAGLTREDASSRLEWGSTKVFRIETARVTVSPGDIRELARIYQIDDTETEQLVELARQAKRPGWWKGMSQALPAGFSVHLELESAAARIQTYEAQFVPGLWQTERYARAVLAARSTRSTPEQVERAIAVRMRRQQLLHRQAPPPPEIWAVIDEAVMRRAVGGREVMREQLTRLQEIAETPLATIQVLPFSAGAHMAAYGSYSLFYPSEPTFPVTASTDRPAGTLIEDDPADIAQYTLIFDHLLAASLRPRDSARLISEAARLT
jgi:hypothetical protein